MSLFSPRNGSELLATYLAIVLGLNPLVVLALMAFFHGAALTLDDYLISLCIAELVSTGCMGAAALAIYARRLWRRRLGLPPRPASRALAFTASFLSMPASLYASFHLTALAAAVLGHPFTPPDLWSARDSMLLASLMGVTSFLAITSRELTREKHEAELATREAARQKLEAQLAALTSQMNPHLLFNALNTVASLIESDPQQAEQTVLRLSELYRGVLLASRRSTHLLSEELDICRAYLAVEHARFGERLRVDIRVDATLGEAPIEVPVLLLQPLVENAVQHGLLGKAAGGTLSIVAEKRGEDLVIVIEDDGVGLGNSGRSGAGVSLISLRERLALAYGGAAHFTLGPRTGGGSRAELVLPRQGTHTRSE